MTAQIIPFPSVAPFSCYVEIDRSGGGYLVICREHGWAHGDRNAANADAVEIARGFGVPARTAAA
jgi:hypothetical protein